MNKRILIADDEPKILQLYKVVFSTSEKEISFFENFETSDGFNVQMFLDGDLLLDAFKEIYEKNERIPLVVLDIYMPGMDGFSVAKEIRKIDSEVMIIFVTGVKAIKSQELRKALDDDIYFLRKPINPDEFLSLISSLIKSWNKTELIRRDMETITHNTKLLNQSMARFDHLTENLRNKYFFYSHDLDGNFRYLSDSVYDILGYTKEEFVKNKSKIYIDSELNILAREYTKKALNGIKQPAFEIELIVKDGKKMYFEVSEFPIFQDGKVIAIEGMAQDITEKKKADKRLAESEEHFRSLLENAKDYVIFRLEVTKNKKVSKVLMISPSITEITGLSEKEANSTTIRRNSR